MTILLLTLRVFNENIYNKNKNNEQKIPKYLEIDSQHCRTEKQQQTEVNFIKKKSY